MAENSARVEVRKLRKKLRQIENLEKLERDLTPEEYTKVSKKSDIRELLKDKLEVLEKEKGIEIMSHMIYKNSRVAEGSTADVNKTDQLVPVEATVSNNKLPGEKSTFVNTECLESTPAKDITHTVNSASEEQHASQVAKSCVTSLSSPSISSIGTSSSTVLSATSSSTSGMKQTKKQSADSGNYEWQDKKFTVKCLEGHNDQVFSVDMDNSVLISGSRDTMLKLWDCDSGKEIRSMGGHTGGITSVLLIRKDDHEVETPGGAYHGITGSHDCSIRIWSLGDGKTLRSIYAYSPVLCLDRDKGRLVSGSEGGKVELWDVEVGENICCTRSDNDSVTCVKFKDERIVSGSLVGTIKVWDVRQRSLAPVLTFDSLNSPFVKKRRVHCLATADNSIYWGDDGTNIKVLDIRTGKVRKLKNHLTEFGSTSAMIIRDSLLISSGYDLDRGTGYLNVRTLPDEEYLATLDDDVTSYISCLSCTDIKTDGVVYQRLCTGGNELKIWDQRSKNKVRKRTRADEDPSFVTSKHLRRYSSASPIDTESSDESDDERRDNSSDDDEDERTTTNARQSWCTIS